MGFLTSILPHGLLSTVHNDTLPATPVLGDMIVANTTPLWDRLPVGSNGLFLGVVGGVPAWTPAPTSAIASYFFTNTASDIGGIYLAMTVGLPVGAEVYTSTTLTGANIPIANWATPVGFPSTTFIPQGTWHVHAHLRRTAGTASSQVFFDIYQRTAGGVETLLGTAGPATVTANPEIEADIDVGLPDTLLLVTDRLVVKARGSRVGAGSDPTVGLGYVGATSSRLDIPVSTSALDHGTLLGLGDDDHLQYALLAGRTGGQTFYGGTAASDPLTIDSTSNVTKGDILVNPAKGSLIGVAMTPVVGPFQGVLQVKAQNLVSGVAVYEDISTNSRAVTALVDRNNIPLCYYGLCQIDGDFLTGTHIGDTVYRVNRKSLYIATDGDYNSAANIPSLTLIANNGPVGVHTVSPSAGLSINGGCHVGGDSDPGDNNLLVDGTTIISGNVGIGTSSPGYNLEVNNAIAAKGGSNPYFSMVDNSGNTVYLEIASGLFRFNAYTPSNMPIGLYQHSTSRLYINTSGNVGIGTETAGSKLSIVGLPTSSSGLSSGDIWVDTTGGANILKIV